MRAFGVEYWIFKRMDWHEWEGSMATLREASAVFRSTYSTYCIGDFCIGVVKKYKVRP